MAGYDTADYIQNQYQSADSTFGSPSFWLRYFSPSPNGTVNSSSTNANNECRSAWNSGGHYLGPITSPGSLTGSSQGHADAQTFASAIYTVFLDVVPMELPSNDVLYCWLDDEPGVTLGVDYWNSWAGYIDTYAWGGGSLLPLYPCLYCDPCNGAHPCTSLKSASYACFAVWSYEPQRCSNSVRNPPSPFAATTCASSSCANWAGGPPTQLWQFAIQGPNLQYACYTSPIVDQDVGGGINYSSYCLDIYASP